MIDSHVETLSRLLDVTADELTDRAQTLFERESGRKYPAPLVLCGAGRLGRITLRGLRAVGADVLGFADNNVGLHGKRLDDCDVYSVEEAVRCFGANAVFVVTIYTARPLREQLAGRSVPVASARSVFFQHPNTFLPHASVDSPASIPGQARAILDGASLWADDMSRDEYVAQIAWHSLASTETPSWVPPDQTYFPEGVVRLGDNEVFVDCGAFDGDTLRAFLQRTGDRFRQIVAFEADPVNFAALRAFVDNLPQSLRDRVDVRPVAVYDRSTTLRFTAADGAGSAVSSRGDVDVHADTLDTLLRPLAPTFIKMDIEGAEPNAIAGASETLRASAPTLAVCLYHAREHLWQLPQAIRDANDAYSIFLRRHSDECWETVAYAVRR